MKEESCCISLAQEKTFCPLSVLLKNSLASARQPHAPPPAGLRCLACTVLEYGILEWIALVVIHRRRNQRQQHFLLSDSASHSSTGSIRTVACRSWQILWANQRSSTAVLCATKSTAAGRLPQCQSTGIFLVLHIKQSQSISQSMYTGGKHGISTGL
jgi:hypothetical protein